MKNFNLSLFLLLLFNTFAIGQSSYKNPISNLAQPLWSIYFTDANTGYTVGSNGVIMKTTNGGGVWTTKESGTSNHLFSIHFVNSNIGWTVGANCTILKTENGGTTWSKQISGLSNDHFITVYFTNHNTGYIATQSGSIIKTNDGGATWTCQRKQRNPFLYSIIFTDENTGFAVGGTGFDGNKASSMIILKTTNSGDTWNEITNGIFDGVLNSIKFTDNSTGYSVGIKNNGNAAILKTTDGGNSWIEQIIPNAYCLRSISFIDKNTGFCCGDGGVTLKTTDGGSSWTDISNSTSKAENKGLYSIFYINESTGWQVGSNSSIIRNSNSTVVTNPTIKTNTINSITSTSVTTGGDIINDGGSPIISRGICWSTVPDPTIAESKIAEGSGIGLFSCNISNLTPSTTYHFRAYATNSAGTVYGEDLTFTTGELKIGDNYAGGIVFYIDNTGQNGLVCAPNDQDGAYTFIKDQKTTTGATGILIWSGKTNTNAIVSVLGDGVYPAKICDDLTLNGYSDWFLPSKNELGLMFTNLKLKGLGNFRNSWEAYWSSSEFSLTGIWAQCFYNGNQFTLDPTTHCYVRPIRAFGNRPTIPTITTLNVSDITVSSAKCGGNIISNGGADITSAGIYWAEHSCPTEKSSSSIEDVSMGSFSSNLKGLSPGTTYYVRAFATNSAGTAFGYVLKFSTTSVLPTINTKITTIGSTTATIGGIISFDGGDKITEKGVCWSINANPTIGDSKVQNNSGNNDFDCSVVGLNHSTTYYFRAYAINSVGIAYGEEVIFKTQASNMLSIGQSYQGGKIAYFLQPGDPGYIDGEIHGLIAAPSDQSNGIQWSINTQQAINTTSGQLGTGSTNTINIVNSQGNGDYAAILCNNLVLEGYSDWYLPSEEELRKIITNKDLIGGFSDDYYWSSTEITNNYAAATTAHGFTSYHSKYLNIKVRAVRSF